MTKFKDNRFFAYILFVVTIVVICIYSFGLFIVLFSVGALYIYMLHKLTSPIFTSKFLVLFVTVFNYSGLLTLVNTIGSAAYNTSLNTVLLSSLVLILLLLFYELFCNKTKIDTRPVFTKIDGISIAVATIALFTMCLLPLLQTDAFHNRNNLLVLATGNVDFGPHIGMFNDYIDIYTTQPWQSNDRVRSVLGGFYPSSWHAANAIIVKSILPSVEPGSKSLAIFGILHVIWICVLVYFITHLSFSLCNAYTKNRSNILSTITMLLCMIIGGYFFIVNLANFGFFPYAAQLTSGILLIYLLQQLLIERVGSNSILSWAILYSALSLSLWLLLAPVFFAAVILTLVSLAYRKWLTIGNILTDLTHNLLIYLLVILSISAQIVLLRSPSSGTSVSFLDGILLTGSATKYDPLVYILLFCCLIISIFLTQKKQLKTSLIEPFIFTATSLVLFCAVLFVIQAYSVSEPRYYFYKSLLMLPILLLPVAIALAGRVVYYIQKKDVLLACISAVSLPALVLVFVPSDTSMMAYARGARSVSAGMNTSIATSLNENQQAGRVSIYMISHIDASDIATTLVQSNRPYSVCVSELRKRKIHTENFEKSILSIPTVSLPSSCKNKEVTFVIDIKYKNMVTSPKNAKFSIEYLQV